MKRMLVILVLLVGVLSGQTVLAQRVCNPYTQTPNAGMLPIGQKVTFDHWEGEALPVQREGQITAYYIQSCWPGIAVIGLDAQAYVVNYGSADGSQIVLNRAALHTTS